MELRTQLEVQGAVQQWTASFMQNNNLNAKTMLDALNNVCLQLKDQVITDLLIAVQEQEQEAAAASQEVIEDDSSSQ